MQKANGINWKARLKPENESSPETKLIPIEHQTPAPEKLVSQTNQQAQGVFFIIQRLLNRGDTKGSPHNHSTKCWHEGLGGGALNKLFAKCINFALLATIVSPVTD
ncbi:MAG: hypothetical protein IJG94_10750 [Clostridia bacterium]|nr:hypothetical protein [Clostridia bacterium]